MKKCSECAEEIQDDAKVFKHCEKRQEAPAGEVAAGLGRLAVIGLVVWVMVQAACSLETESESGETDFPVPDWISDGTLHESTLDEWSEADDRDKLATAADFTIVLREFSDVDLFVMLSAGDDLAELRADAIQLVECIDVTIDLVQAELSTEKTGEAAAGCAVGMGWVEASEDEPPDPPAGSGQSEAGFGNGTHLVGTDLEPGTYRAEAGLDGCYWERLSGLGGELEDIIANDMVDEGSTIVTIAPMDRAFSSEGCGRWRRIESVPHVVGHGLGVQPVPPPPRLPCRH